MAEPASLHEIIHDCAAMLLAPLSTSIISDLTYPGDDKFYPVDHLTFLTSEADAHFSLYFRDGFSYGSSSHGNRAVRQLRNIEAVEAHVLRRLAHIPVNPHDAYNTRALIQSYCFTAPLDSPEAAPQFQSPIVNSTPQAADAFVRSVIDMARSQTALMHATVDRQGKALSQPRAVFLHGPRGAGKTFFENYLLSKFSDFLDASRVIWVRLNLVDLTEYDSLFDWFHGQAAKIILRYYSASSTYFVKQRGIAIDVPGYLEATVLPSMPRKARERLTQAFLKARLLCEKGGGRGTGISDEQISPSLIPDDLALHIVASARAAGWHFVAVFDGLDMLEITREYRQRFDKFVKQVLALISTNKRNGFAIIVACRSLTMRTIFKREYHDTYNSAGAEEFEIAAPDLETVLKSRLAYVKQELHDLAMAGELNASSVDIDSHIDGFMAWLSARETPADGSSPVSFITALDALKDKNIRSKMYMVQYKYYEYIAKHHVAFGGYHLIEAMMKAGRRFPPVHYKYEMDSGGIRRTIHHRQMYESRYFPNVFRFPFISQPTRITPDRALLAAGVYPPRLMSVVLGVRILQILDAMRRLYETPGAEFRGDAINVGDVCAVGEFCFGYSPLLTSLFLEEMAECQLIDLSHALLRSPSSEAATDNDLVMLPKASYLLDHYLYDIAYMNMCAMRVPLPARCFNTRAQPYFVSAALDEDDDSLGRWIGAKFTNTLGLCRLVAYINSVQEIELAQRFGRDSAIDERVLAVVNVARSAGMFQLPDRMRRAALEQLERNISGVLGGLTRTEVSTRVVAYRNSWQ